MVDLSVLLWTKLRRFVGTEEQVYIRRRSNLLHGILNSHIYITPISSGSKAEGLDLPGSDTDLMFVLKPITVFQKPCAHNHHCDILLDTNNIKPGFARLRVVDRLRCRRDTYIGPSIIEMNDNMYVSSSLFLKKAMMTYTRGNEHSNLVYHGPCASGTIEYGGFEFDYLLCLHCPWWPNEASEWIQRHRPNNWPSKELIQQIVAEGCLLVPIGIPQSKMNYLEWRISLSTAEKMLVHSMNHTQFLCYGLLKLYLKYVFDSIEGVGGLLCSYFLKTCLFHCIEEENISWNKENFIKCFWTCFRRLYVWVRQGYCPNYFIKDNNMFESKIYGSNQRKLLQCLTTLYRQGFDVFIQIPCLADVENIAAMSGGSRLALRFASEHEHEFVVDMELFKCFMLCHFNIQAKHTVLESVISQSSISIIDQVLLSHAFFCFKVQLSQQVYKTKVCKQMTNKEKYKLVTKLKQFILSFKHGDMCTGFLQCATLCYMLGEYDDVFHILLHVLRKFSDCKVLRGLSHVNIKSEPAYITEVCGRGLTIAQKMKHYVACSYVCVTECEMYPPEIRAEIFKYSYKGDTVCIPPVVCCIVLLILTCNASDRSEIRDYMLNELCEAVQDEYTVGELERPLSIALLEKCTAIVNAS